MRKSRKFSPDEKTWEEVRFWRRQTWSALAQIFIAAISIAAVVIAALVARVTYVTAQNDARTSLRQAQDSQLSAAVDALGADAMPERVAGLLLLTRNTQGRFAEARQTEEPSGEVYDDYTTALQILSGYLNSQSEQYVTTAPSDPPFGFGYGAPTASDSSIDLHYAADQVRILLGSPMEHDVARLHSHKQPEIDLSDDELYGQSWKGVDFAWVDAYMPHIDLRNANLEYSQWGPQSDLWRAYLQCSDLSYADFQRADLMGADLRGALVQGADFRGAQMKFLEPTTVYGTAQWPTPMPADLTVLPASQWNQLGCLQYRGYWDNAPTPPSVKPTAQASAKPKAQSSVK
jgi:hypothetical protein